MAQVSKLAQLADLLAGHAKPVIRPQRLAPATIYDIDYRMAVVALTIRRHGTKTTEGTTRIDVARLKLLQFIAQRPNMVPAMREWAVSKNASGLLRDSPQRLRRGYIGDSTHDQAVEYMIACRILRPDGRYLVEEKNSTYIGEVHNVAIKNNMFESERMVLEELSQIRITNAMLEGQ